MLLRAEDHGSPDFPPVCFPCEKQTGDHPTHPLLDYNPVDVYSNGVLHFPHETMQMNAPAPAIELWDSAFLEEIAELDWQALRLVVAEAKAGLVATPIRIGDVDLGGGYPVDTRRRNLPPRSRACDPLVPRHASG